MAEQLVVGIDVSKAKLDVAISPSGEQFTVSNDRLGAGQLVQRLTHSGRFGWCWKRPASWSTWRPASWLPPGFP